MNLKCNASEVAIKTYLSLGFKFWWTIIFLLLIICQQLTLILLWFFLGIGVFFTFRKSVNSFQDSISNTEGGVFLSPVSGRINFIHNDFQGSLLGSSHLVIQIVMQHFVETGIYLPIKSKVMQILRFPGKSFYRYRKKGSLLREKNFHEKYENVLVKIKGSFSTGPECEIGIQLFKCPFGGRPKIWVMEGDSGKIGANWGYFPGGGSVIIYLPKQFRILVENNQTVVAGQTLLAGLQV